MIDRATLARLLARNATIARLRVPAYVTDAGYQVPTHVDYFVSVKAASDQALMFTVNGPLSMPTPIVERVNVREAVQSSMWMGSRA